MTAYRPIAIVLLVALFAGCGGTTPSAERSGSDPAVAPSPRPTVKPVPGHEVYGFVPYWEMDDTIAEHLAATDLTTLALFSVTHKRNGTVDNQNGLRRISGDVGSAMIRAAHERGTRSSSSIRASGRRRTGSSTLTRRRRHAGSTSSSVFVVDLQLDGVNVDVEALTGRARRRLRRVRRPAPDRAPGWRCPMRRYPWRRERTRSGAAMAAAASAAGADRIFLMGYDYRSAGSQPGASAPIDRMDGERRKDLVWSLDSVQHAAACRSIGRSSGCRCTA